MQLKAAAEWIYKAGVMHAWAPMSRKETLPMNTLQMLSCCHQLYGHHMRPEKLQTMQCHSLTGQRETEYSCGMGWLTEIRDGERFNSYGGRENPCYDTASNQTRT